MKKSDSFLSVPVSRVGSINRLAGLSDPSTPASYVPLSLNPNRNSPMVSKPDQDLLITQRVNEFETTLAELSVLISSFKDDDVTPLVERLISINHDITHEIDVLQTHQRLGKQIAQLQHEKDELDTQAKHILKELISHRQKLKELPRLPAKKRTDDVTPIDIQETLKYASKLAKFTKAPTSSAGTALQVHPNNYIWPAEDALRRGNLAMATIKGDEIIQAELGEKDEEKEIGSDKTEMARTETDKTDTEKTETEAEPPVQKAPAVEAKARPPAPKDVPKAPAALDLDLFDPDADSDDSD